MKVCRAGMTQCSTPSSRVSSTLTTPSEALSLKGSHDFCGALSPARIRVRTFGGKTGDDIAQTVTDDGVSGATRAFGIFVFDHVDVLYETIGDALDWVTHHRVSEE